LVSNLGCKIFGFSASLFASLPPWLLVYIASEKLLSIMHPNKRYLLRKHKYKITYIFILLILNSFYYLIFAFNYDIENETFINGSNNSITFTNDNYSKTECQMKSSSIRALNYIDFTNKFIVSCSFLVSLTLVLIRTKAIRLKKRIWQNYSPTENRAFKRDIKLANTSIGFNIIFIGLNFPNFFFSCVKSISSDLNAWRTLTFYLYYASFSFKFYIMLILNSSFKKAVLALLFSKKNSKIDISADISVKNF